MAASCLVMAFPQFFSDNGTPLAGGFLASYIAGTMTPQALYTDSDLATAYDNPIELDGAGRTPGPIYMLATPAYDLYLTDADNVAVAQATFISAAALPV